MASETSAQITRIVWMLSFARASCGKNLITADANGKFRIQVLVFHNDQTGRRELVAESVAGTPFPSTEARMLVSESSMGPPGFVLQLLIDVPLVLMIR